MTDSTWMRTYREKSIWTGNGNICSNGSFGAGTSIPQHKLDVRGTARAETFITDYEYKTQDAGVVKHGGILAMDQFTYRRVVPQRWSGYIVWTPVANDHAAFAMRVVMNSNAGNGSRAGNTLSPVRDGVLCSFRSISGCIPLRERNP